MSFLEDILIRAKLLPPPKKAESVKIEIPQSVVGALPIQGGRSSQAESASTLSNISGLTIVQPVIPKEFIEAIEHLSIFNPDFSHAVDNICDLAATDYRIEFPATVSDKVAKAAKLHIENVSKIWYLFGDGKKGLVTDLLRQCCNAGCVSAEIVPMKNLRGIEKVVLVKPSSIEFLYDDEKDTYSPYQRPKTLLNVQRVSQNLGLVELNTVTYKYYAMYRTNDHPYAIPPLVAAIENTNIGRDLMGNLKWVAKNMGTLGVVSIFTTPPGLAPGETPNSDTYLERCNQWLTRWRTEAELGLKNGIIVGFKGSHEIEVTPSHVSASGAKDLWQMNDTQFVSGLKQDGVLLNRDTKTSEAFAKVMYEILKSRIRAFQDNVGIFLQSLHLMELQLAGFPIPSLNVVFDKVALSDKLAEAQAEAVEISNIEKKYLMGIISQDMAAQELGYESAFEEAPLNTQQVFNLSGKKQKKKSGELVKHLIAGYARAAKFDYESEQIAQNTKIFSFDEDDKPLFDDDGMQSLYEEYINSINTKFEKTVNKAMDAMAESMKTVQATISVEELISKFFFYLYGTFQDTFLNRIRNTISSIVEKGYRKFRKDKSIFGNNADQIGKVNLAMPDFRALNYFKASDQLYLGKFITDDDTRERLTKFIKDTYLRDGEQITHNPTAIDRFRKQLGTEVINENWKINRIVSTTVNKMRNYAAVNYMQQAEISEFEIRGVKDRKQCAYCAGMQGKRFQVAQVAEKIDAIVSREPDFVSSDAPFITAVFKDPSVIEGMSSDDLFNKGICIPPLHPFCRDVVIAVIN